MSQPNFRNLSYTDKVRIQKEVMLGAAAPSDESPDAAAWRAAISEDFRKANAEGYTLDFPSDWE